MGNFINFSAGYANTYLHQELFVSLQRDFLRPQSVYAGGLTALRSFRTDRVYLNSNVTTIDPLNYIYLDGWYGRRLKLGINPNDSRFQMTLSGRVRYTHFYDRPLPDSNNNQYFTNSKFYLGSLSFSHRSYVRDYLVYIALMSEIIWFIVMELLKIFPKVICVSWYLGSITMSLMIVGIRMYFCRPVIYLKISPSIYTLL